MAITCPGAGTRGAVTFGHTVRAAAPYTVAIDYGDGRSYANDDRHLSSVFSHTYASAGSFDVSARLTDAAGRSVEATCTWTRTAPATSAAAAGATGAGGSAGSGSGSGDEYYTNVDGNQVHRPEAAPAAPDGATAQCGDGTYSSSQHRSGTCSHHGGVAAWL